MAELVFYAIIATFIAVVAWYIFIALILLSTIHVGDGKIKKDIERLLLINHVLGYNVTVFHRHNLFIIKEPKSSNVVALPFDSISFKLCIKMLAISSSEIEPMQALRFIKKESYMSARNRFVILYLFRFQRGNPFWGRG